MDEFIARAAPEHVRVRSADPDALAALLRAPGVTVSAPADGTLTVSGLSAEQIGTIAGAAGISVFELATEQASLEDAFLDLTRDAVEFRAGLDDRRAVMTTDAHAARQRLPAYTAPQRVTQTRVLRSEWTKMRTQPSVVWALLSTVVLIVGVGALYSLLRESHPPADQASFSSFDPTAISLAGVNLAQLAIGVLGVLLITNEYATGLIRTSFAAVPSRLPILWAKAIALALTTVTLCIPATFAAFLIGQSILSSSTSTRRSSQPGVTRAVLGSALYLGGVGLLGLGLGALLRNTAAAISALFGALFAAQIIVGFLPSTWSDDITRYLPSPAGVAVTAVLPDPSSLPPWTGLGVFLGYPAVILATRGLPDAPPRRVGPAQTATWWDIALGG